MDATRAIARRPRGSRGPLLRLCAAVFLGVLALTLKRALSALSKRLRRPLASGDTGAEHTGGAQPQQRLSDGGKTGGTKSNLFSKSDRQDSRTLADALRDGRRKERRRRKLRVQGSGISVDASSGDEDGRSGGGLSPKDRGRSDSALDCSSSEDESGASRLLSFARKPQGSVQDMSSLTGGLSSSAASFAIQCCERRFPGRDARPPVKLVVFDFDETLTIATFMAEGTAATEDSAKREKFRRYNFETPWVRGDRIAKLKAMLEELSRNRTLAVLSRNSAGVEPVLDLLRIAELDVYFAAVWIMPWFPGRDNGAYRADGGWKYFDPPLSEVEDHKADVLHQLVRSPAPFFPQLGGERRGFFGGSASPRGRGSPDSPLAGLRSIKLAEIVLVDDNGANFKSETGLEVTRYAKVARYDAPYRTMGTLHDIGGIGARDASDYNTLVRFVTNPWQFPEARDGLSPEMRQG